MSLNLSKFRINALPGFLFAAGLVFSVPMLKANALSASDIVPIYLSSGDETAINVDIPPNTALPNSFGYFFDIAVGRKGLNALGLATQAPWGSGNYDVTLWKYVNSGATIGDYTQLATATFAESCVGTTCITKDYFYWLGVPLLYLDETASDPTQGYAVSAIGDFSTNTGASIFIDGNGVFDSAASYDGGGYNFSGGSGYPIPVGDPLDITTGAGFYNSNISLFQVPGPLPVMGAAAAYGWSRRLRRRINTSA